MFPTAPKRRPALFWSPPAPPTPPGSCPSPRRPLSRRVGGRPAGPRSQRRRGGGEAVARLVPGDELAVEGLLSGGSLEVLAVFDKPDPLEGPYFEETIYVTPSRLPDEKRTQVEHASAEAAKALGLTEGPVHAELRLDG